MNKIVDARLAVQNPVSVLKQKKRKILVILSNRWNRTQKPHLLELDCDAEGNIHKRRPLRSLPREARFHEVWENDEGRTEFDACFRFSRKYGHKLQVREAGNAR